MGSPRAARSRFGSDAVAPKRVRASSVRDCHLLRARRRWDCTGCTSRPNTNQGEWGIVNGEFRIVNGKSVLARRLFLLPPCRAIALRPRRRRAETRSCVFLTPEPMANRPETVARPTHELPRALPAAPSRDRAARRASHRLLYSPVLRKPLRSPAPRNRRMSKRPLICYAGSAAETSIDSTPIGSELICYSTL